MNTVEIKTNEKMSIVEFTQIVRDNGYGCTIPIIDGVTHPELAMGYVSEEDKKAGIDLLKLAIKSTNSLSEAKRYIHDSMKEIAHDEATVVIDGITFKVYFKYKKICIIYNNREVANANDVKTDDKDILLTVLKDRAKLWIIKQKGVI